MSGRQRYDPRLGDEDVDEDVTINGAGRAEDFARPPMHVRIPTDIAHDSKDSDRTQKEGREVNAKTRPVWASRLGKACRKLLPFDFAWIPANFTWSKLKPVIRCAVVCWVSAVLMIIPRTSSMMGQVSRRSSCPSCANLSRVPREVSSFSSVSDYPSIAHICNLQSHSFLPGRPS